MSAYQKKCYTTALYICYIYIYTYVHSIRQNTRNQISIDKAAMPHVQLQKVSFQRFKLQIQHERKQGSKEGGGLVRCCTWAAGWPTKSEQQPKNINGCII